MESKIYHSGIKGQKWGVRNGPPYPLDSNQKSKAEKKAMNKSSGSDGVKVQRKTDEWKKTSEKSGLFPTDDYVLTDKQRSPKGEIRIHSPKDNDLCINTFKKHYKNIINEAVNQIVDKHAKNAWLFDDPPYNKYDHEQRKRLVSKILNRSDIGINLDKDLTQNDRFVGEMFFDDVRRTIGKDGKLHYNYDESLYADHWVIVLLEFNKDGKTKVIDTYC